MPCSSGIFSLCLFVGSSSSSLGSSRLKDLGREIPAHQPAKEDGDKLALLLNPRALYLDLLLETPL